MSRVRSKVPTGQPLASSAGNYAFTNYVSTRTRWITAVNIELRLGVVHLQPKV